MGGTGMRKLGGAVVLLQATLAGGIAVAGGLAGSEWRPVQLGEQRTEESDQLFVRFEAQGRLSGNGGCNRFFGAYESTGEQLVIGPLGATRMACPGPVMELETAFLQALEQARGYSRDGTTLELSDAQGKTLAILRQTDWD